MDLYRLISQTNSEIKIAGSKLMKIYSVFSLLTFVVLLSSCSKSMLIQADKVNEISLNQYKTFRFVENDANPNFTFNEANQERVKLAVAAELEQRNYEEAALADFLIKVQGNIEMIRETGTMGPMYNYYDPFFMNNRLNRAPRDANESTVIINVIDQASNKLVWQGVATGNFKKKKTHIEVVIRETIQEMFLQFPYQSQVNL
ncbi:MAG: DUF4136 domain-containing protein [Candidatus Cyclobacteriaceae bacterium M3_2C_046]